MANEEQARTSRTPACGPGRWGHTPYQPSAWQRGRGAKPQPPGMMSCERQYARSAPPADNLDGHVRLPHLPRHAFRSQHPRKSHPSGHLPLPLTGTLRCISCRHRRAAPPAAGIVQPLAREHAQGGALPRRHLQEEEEMEEEGGRGMGACGGPSRATAIDNVNKGHHPDQKACSQAAALLMHAGAGWSGGASPGRRRLGVGRARHALPCCAPLHVHGRNMHTTQPSRLHTILQPHTAPFSQPPPARPAALQPPGRCPHQLGQLDGNLLGHH